MATALSAQLSAIAATSTNQLDLKAQRRAHSQSLIFDPHIAATQDFDTIYDFCVEGYHELCRLEPRFSPFSKSIFSLASKSQERSRMTAAQNEELNKVLEQFLLLVGSKVLLQPAVKALDWLIRRFRYAQRRSVPTIGGLRGRLEFTRTTLSILYSHSYLTTPCRCSRLCCLYSRKDSHLLSSS